MLMFLGMISECEETPAVHANKDWEKKKTRCGWRERERVSERGGEGGVEEIAAILRSYFKILQQGIYFNTGWHFSKSFWWIFSQPFSLWQSLRHRGDILMKSCQRAVFLYNAIILLFTGQTRSLLRDQNESDNMMYSLYVIHILIMNHFQILMTIFASSPSLNNLQCCSTFTFRHMKFSDFIRYSLFQNLVNCLPRQHFVHHRHTPECLKR